MGRGDEEIHSSSFVSEEGRGAGQGRAGQADRQADCLLIQVVGNYTQAYTCQQAIRSVIRSAIRSSKQTGLAYGMKERLTRPRCLAAQHRSALAGEGAVAGFDAGDRTLHRFPLCRRLRRRHRSRRQRWRAVCLVENLRYYGGHIVNRTCAKHSHKNLHICLFLLLRGAIVNRTK